MNFSGRLTVFCVIVVKDGMKSDMMARFGDSEMVRWRSGQTRSEFGSTCLSRAALYMSSVMPVDEKKQEQRL